MAQPSDVDSSKKSGVQSPLEQGEIRCQKHRERGGKALSDRKTDKLPDIMGPILPPEIGKNKNPGAINGTVAKRHDVETHGEGGHPPEMCSF